MPLNDCPPPLAGLVVPNHHSPPATPLAPPPTTGSAAPFAVRVTVAVPAAIEFGVRVMEVKVGPVRSIRSVAVATGPQLPAASRAWT